MKHSIKDIFANHPVREKEEDLYKVKKVPYHKDDLKLLEKLAKASLYKHNDYSGSGGFHGGGAGFGGTGYPKDQRVMFKMSYSGSKAVHQKYLNTYMPQENKDYVTEKPELFGTPDEQYNENMDDMHFKCIISPENQEVDLQLLSREFIKRVEAMTGYKLYWKGCIHNDTEHRHAHLCINGKDANGKNVRFQKEMIRTTMRETLSYVTTQLVGERTDKEIEAARKGLINSKRWTELDQQLEAYGHKISFNNLSAELVSRLAFLSELNLAEKHEKYYTLKNDWQEVLVSTGRYNTFLEEWQKSNGNLKLYSGGNVRGICEGVVTFDKDEAWNDAVIINDGTKRIYVPVWQLQKENLVGKEIEISGGTRALSRQIKDRDIKVVLKEKLIDNERKRNRAKNVSKDKDVTEPTPDSL